MDDPIRELLRQCQTALDSGDHDLMQAVVDAIRDSMRRAGFSGAPRNIPPREILRSTVQALREMLTH